MLGWLFQLHLHGVVNFRQEFAHVIRASLIRVHRSLNRLEPGLAEFGDCSLFISVDEIVKRRRKIVRREKLQSLREKEAKEKDAKEIAEIRKRLAKNIIEEW